MIGSYYGDSITLGATSGDRSFDKNETFASKSSDILSYIYGKSWWCEGRDISIDLKYKSHTKKQLIDAYVSKGYNIDDLAESSFSCYHPTLDGKPCGLCKPCTRKWVSLLPYKDISYIYSVNPREYYTRDILASLESNIGTNLSRGDEDLETLKILREYL
jgi:7-cyano-7-deazaguanine synthase in queuosine biosynthesis